MTLFLDDDYGNIGLLLRPECERRNIPFDMSDLNARGWGDTLYITNYGTYSGEIKGAGELLGGMDHCEAQLQKQLASADRCFLAVYGKVEPAGDGNSMALDAGHEHVVFHSGPDLGTTRNYKKRHYRVNYLGYRTWLARLVSLGVDVYEVPSREALATQLIALYHTLTTEGSTLRRVIVEKPRVSEQDPTKARFMRQLMGLEAGIGEELAEAIAGWHATCPVDEKGISALIWMLNDTDITPLATWPLRSGKRTVGPVAVQRLREALGLT